MEEKQKNEPELDSSSSSDDWSSCSTDSNPDKVMSKVLNIRSPYFNPTLALMCKDIPNPVPSPEIPPTKYTSIVQFKNWVPSFSGPARGRGGRAIGRGRGRGRGSRTTTSTTTMTTTTRSKSAIQNLQSQKSQSQSATSQPSTSKSNPPTANPTEVPSSASSAIILQKVAESEKENKKDEEPPPAQVPFYPIPGRKFLPHQLPVYRPRKQQPNVLTLMDSERGPLSVLNKVRKEGRRIKVWTRNITGIRGFCVGSLDAFDKHWNLVLKDVDEQFQRKRRIKFPIEFSSTNINHFSQEHEKEEDEDMSYKSGEFLSSYSKNQEKQQKQQKNSIQDEKESSIVKGLKTMSLIEGPDALKTCRFGLEGLNASSQNSELIRTQSQMRKKCLVILDSPRRDFHGNYIVAQSKKYEIVRRHVRQLFLMGNEVVFIETETEPG